MYSFYWQRVLIPEKIIIVKGITFKEKLRAVGVIESDILKAVRKIIRTLSNQCPFAYIP